MKEPGGRWPRRGIDLTCRFGNSNRRQDMRRIAMVALLASLALAAFGSAHGQGACSHRGDLDPQYCDANRDLVADTPADAAKLKTPNTLVFTYTPVEDPAVYEKIVKPFT